MHSLNFTKNSQPRLIMLMWTSSITRQELLSHYAKVIFIKDLWSVQYTSFIFHLEIEFRPKFAVHSGVSETRDGGKVSHVRP